MEAYFFWEGGGAVRCVRTRWVGLRERERGGGGRWDREVCHAGSRLDLYFSPLFSLPFPSPPSSFNRRTLQATVPEFPQEKRSVDNA